MNIIEYTVLCLITLILVALIASNTARIEKLSKLCDDNVDATLYQAKATKRWIDEHNRIHESMYAFDEVVGKFLLKESK